MRYLLFCLFALGALVVHAQDFTPKDTLHVQGITQSNVHWLDANNDGRFDLLLSGQNASIVDSSRSLTQLFFQQADSTFLPFAIDFELSGKHQNLIHDFSRDGLPDLLIADEISEGPKHFLYTNNGDSTFTKTAMPGLEEEPFGHWQVIDLNNDGQVELALNFAEGNRLFEFVDGQWELLETEIEEIDVRSKLVFYDYDRNGFKDILLLGQRLNNQSVALIAKNYGTGVYQKLNQDLLDIGKIEEYVLHDIDSNGFTDVLISGKFEEERGVRFILNNATGQLTDSILALDVKFESAKLFMGDLNSDGIWDVDLEGRALASNTYVRKRALSDSAKFDITTDTLMNSIGLGRQYADLDFDGDLDYIEITSVQDSVAIVIYANTAKSNLGPLPITSFLSIKYNGNIYMGWDVPTDDHTTSSSISYDLAVGTSNVLQDLVSPSLNASTKRRSLSVLGSVEFNNYYIFQDAPDGETFVNIMPIDNTFHYAPVACFTGEGAQECNDLEVVEQQFCEPTTVNLSTPNGEKAFWFSIGAGFVGYGEEFTTFVGGNAQFMALFERPDLCAQGKLFKIYVDRAPAQIPDQQVCAGEVFEVSLAQTYKTYTWTSLRSGQILSTTRTLSFIPENDDEIELEVISSGNCTYSQTFELEAVNFEVGVADSVITIKEGESTVLEASGGVRYFWSPSEALNNPNLSNPVASPDKTTLYTVFAVNALGCVAENTVSVEVIQTAFLPESFSPNGDGRNDFYKIYDLGETGDFTFSIFDRIGNLVFESSNYNLVANRGWDGTQNGNYLPAGSYFWRIRGVYTDGQKIKINDGFKGALQLIR